MEDSGTPKKRQCEAIARRSLKQCRYPAKVDSNLCSIHSRRILVHDEQLIERSDGSSDPRLEEFFRALRLGVPITVAAAYARLPWPSVYKWLRKGMKGDPQYAKFVEDVMHHAAAPIVDSAKVVQHNLSKWAVRWLEYRYSKLGEVDRDKADDLDEGDDN